MQVLIFGATGATGKHLALQLLKRGIHIRVLIREGSSLAQEIIDNPLTDISRGNVHDLSSS